MQPIIYCAFRKGPVLSLKRLKCDRHPFETTSCNLFKQYIQTQLISAQYFYVHFILVRVEKPLKHHLEYYNTIKVISTKLLADP